MRSCYLGLQCLPMSHKDFRLTQVKTIMLSSQAHCISLQNLFYFDKGGSYFYVLALKFCAVSSFGTFSYIWLSLGN